MWLAMMVGASAGLAAVKAAAKTRSSSEKVGLIAQQAAFGEARSHARSRQDAHPPALECVAFATEDSPE